MKLQRYYLVCLILFAALTSAAEVHIREVGLQGYLGYSGPEQLRVEMSNPSAGPDSFVLRVSQEKNFRQDAIHLDYKVDLQGHESRLLVLPVLFGNDAKITVEQVTSSGKVISKDEESAFVVGQELVAVVCDAPAICSAVSDAIRSAGTVEEQNARERNLKIVLLTEPPHDWFAYSPVRTLIVAGPVNDQAARDAIESFTRFGGHLIIASDQAPRDFLASYRAADTRAVAVGRGTLTSVNSATGQQLHQLFTPGKSASANDNLTRLVISVQIGSSTLLQWVGKQFVFPRLRWLIGWMVAYILLIGLLNFFILRRIGKVELGWLTVPVIAVIFAMLFYLMSAHGKMKHFSLDQATVCYMDDKSPVGVAEHSFRIASPQVRDLIFQMPVSAIVNSAGQDPLFRASDAATIWDDNGSRRTKLREMVVDSAQHVPLEMLRFSFRDLEFRSVHQFPGTVAMKNDTLTNNTGQDFSQAVLINFSNGQIYDLGPLRAGEKIQPFAKPVDDLKRYDHIMRSSSPEYHMQGAFKLREFVQSDNFSSTTSQPYTFIGFTKQPLLAGQVEGITPDTETYTLFNVTLENAR